MYNFHDIFNLLPACYVILLPDAPRFTILEANQAYLQVANRTRDIIGKGLFEMFPDNPDNATATGVKNLTASLVKAIETKNKQVMPVQRYDTRSADGQQFEVRYWKPINIPVLNEDQSVKYIIHCVEEVTDEELMRKDIMQKEAFSQQQITDAIQTTQEMERLEVSQELHDNVNQILNTARLYLEQAMHTAPAEIIHLKLGHTLVEKAMEEVKKLSNALLFSSDEEINLTETLEDLLGQVIDLKDINISKQIELPDETLIESKVKNTVIRIVQEQLSNVVKHSEARNLFIDLNFTNNKLKLMIKDDGRGFDPSKHTEGRGLQNIKSRAAILNGQVLITSFPGDGCVIQVYLPVKGN